MTQEGDFSFISDAHFRVMLEEAYNAIHVANSWDFISEGCGVLSFSESSAPELYEITSYMNMKMFNAPTFDFVMEEMNLLSAYGWVGWVQRIKKLNNELDKL